MIGLNANVSALNAALQETPEVLQAVSVDVPSRVGFGVVNNVVDVLGIQAFVRLERIGMNLRTLLYILPDLNFQGAALGIRYDLRANFAVPLQQPHDCN